ncbi:MULTISPECIES: prolyl oligopeptidase family serine peptidase [Idiomarina]|jgi:prolyl oligopeptidase|uniref:prolyl oligopeptidase family serine peptidase n=1 Tax=Idiomarina TaxID=135575 RepID=UPI000C641769|nr:MULTISPECIES: prolyl oligopeptidase family serine peptidase [Idiomarina]MAB20925.1 S9 family peptidase [Idiomarina sp.]MBH93957.1 S9 family peptidase [Idiomarina sp.]|tara:strand:+ start:104239 stop:106395 length:2157 start_codon:yes stop_codon:yes gene_type:complete
MTRYSVFIACSTVLILSACSSFEKEKEQPEGPYPETKTVDQQDNYHGTLVEDPYRWLEQNNQEVENWVNEQNQLSTPALQDYSQFQNIKDRMTELWNYEKVSTPFRYADRYFYFSNDGLQNQAVLYTMTDLSSAPDVLINPNTFSDDGTVSLARISVSPQAKYVAYALSDGGSDWTQIKVRNIQSGKDTSDLIKGVKFSEVAWLPNERGFYYSRYPQKEDGSFDDSKPVSVYFHKLGTKQSEDELIFAFDKKPSWNPYPKISDDGQYLLVDVFKGYDANAVYVRPLAQEEAPFKSLFTAWDGQYQYVTSHNGKLYFKTTNGAPTGQVIAVDPSQPAPENWTEIIAPKTHTLKEVSAVGGQLFAHYLQSARSRVAIFDIEGTMLQELALPGIGSIDGFKGSHKAPDTFFTFKGFTEPGKVYRYQPEQQRTTLWYETEVPASLDQYTTEQVVYNSTDGTEVPMFLVHHKDLELNGNNPTLLYGYGGFNISLTPGYDTTRVVWLEMGGVLAIPNLRGGGEFGEKWHQQGTKENKQNVFDDFIAAAEWLINNNYTNKDKLAIQGRSNGGLLVGATMVQRPELFAAALPAVGVLDMLRYQLPSANARGWSSEFGLSENEEDFKTLYEYSPVHNTEGGTCYPPTLITTGDHDNRVVPWHSYKFAAALQRDQSCDNPILLNVETRAGHGAGTPTWMRIEEHAENWAFLHKHLGMDSEAAQSNASE